jgi:hypothetical protein
MASRKENNMPMASQARSGRITRAQAAASRARVGDPCIPLPMKTEQKQALRGKTKRGPPDQSTSAISGPQPKRRTVLKDVTNTSRPNSIRKCTAPSKLQVPHIPHITVLSSWCNCFPKHCQCSIMVWRFLFPTGEALPKGCTGRQQVQTVC